MSDSVDLCLPAPHKTSSPIMASTIAKSIEEDSPDTGNAFTLSSEDKSSNNSEAATPIEAPNVEDSLVSSFEKVSISQETEPIDNSSATKLIARATNPQRSSMLDSQTGCTFTPTTPSDQFDLFKLEGQMGHATAGPSYVKPYGAPYIEGLIYPPRLFFDTMTDDKTTEPSDTYARYTQQSTAAPAQCQAIVGQSSVTTPPLSPTSSYALMGSDFNSGSELSTLANALQHTSILHPNHIAPPSEHVQPMTEQEWNDLIALLDQIENVVTPHPLLATSFTSPTEAPLRTLLQTVLSADWYMTHAFEPKNDKGCSIYFDFLSHDPTGTYQCLFCNKNFDRQDRALGHIRMHLGHRPHACGGRCGASGCLERFFCSSYLRSHTKRQKVVCGRCDEAFFRQHLRKHKLVCQGVQNQAAMPLAGNNHFYMPYNAE